MKRIKRTVLALTLASITVLPVFAQAGTVSQNEYRTLVRECKMFLNRREITEAEAKQLAARLRGIRSVTLPDGRTVPVETKEEADALDDIVGTTPDKQVRARFEALETQLNTGSKTSSKTDPQQLAKRILSAGEFASSQPKKDEKGWDLSFWPKWAQPIGKFFSGIGEWFAKVFRSFGKWIGRNLNNMFRAIGRFFRWVFQKFPQGKTKWNVKNPFASLGNNVLLALCFLAIVGAFVGLYFLVRYLTEVCEVRTGRKKRAGVLGGDLDLTEEGITDPLGSAQTRAAQGDYRAAIRLTYIAALWRLGESGALTLEKNRTNWEYQRALRKKSKTLHDDLLPATRLFDRVWYGKQPGTQAEFETVSEIYRKLPVEFIDPEATDQASTTEGSAV